MTAPAEVTFESDGLRLSGHLRVPPDAHEALPALVFTGPLTGVKEQVTGHYAEALAGAGYVTLAFDHRGFGASEGTPRQHEDPAGKLADLRDALSWLAAHPAVDPGRLGCVGVCLGGGYALRFAAFDPRVRALVTVAGGYNDPRAMRAGMGADGYRAVLAEQMALAARQQATGEVEYMAAVSDDATPALMGGAEPFEYYGTERARSQGWVNRITRTSLYSLLTTDLAVGADFISPTPWLMVHGRADDYCSPAGAETTFGRAGEPKEALWLDTTNHIDLYDVPAYVDPAVDAAGAWLARWL
ncbi:MAG: alpha/beta hydrolase [Actinomycetota bacterium]|nr:alpha/beta hydrolase [Actinomycetota bacterium]